MTIVNVILLLLIVFVALIGLIDELLMHPPVENSIRRAKIILTLALIGTGLNLVYIFIK